jgi:Na+/H+ antiporter NhaD/arsenite permease-like protein
MITLLIIVFVIGYSAIIFEEKIGINKTASALLTGVVCWVIASLITKDIHDLNEKLMHHTSEIASILFFLMGAMTIVELIDTYHGFDIITKRITTRSQSKLMWIICIISFLLSALLDNLTTTIVMITLVKKLMPASKIRITFAAMIVVAANAGGAWSPMGDVTTTMLWIGGQLTAQNLILWLFLPSFVCLLVPLIIISKTSKGLIIENKIIADENSAISPKEKLMIFLTGLGGLISVILFKNLTHLPPFMGMLLALGFIWLVAEILLKNKEAHHKNQFSVYKALEKIDMPSILFFLGILLSVAALQTVGLLTNAANWLTTTFENQTVIVSLIGLLSALVDNVPLVAAAMGMYSLEQYPVDNDFWKLLGYCAGTGGSVLIIGSAAGVAAMGLEKIDFFWYFKKISWLALLGYFAGIGVFLIQKLIFA